MIALFALAGPLGYFAFKGAAVHAAVAVFAALLGFMGGRVLGPAVLGYLDRQGPSMAVRLQPRLEGVVLIALAGAGIAELASARMVAGGAYLAAGVAVLTRMVR